MPRGLTARENNVPVMRVVCPADDDDTKASAEASSARSAAVGFVGIRYLQSYGDEANNNNDSDCSLESVDLTSRDVDIDEFSRTPTEGNRIVKEAPQTPQTLRQKAEKVVTAAQQTNELVSTECPGQDAVTKESEVGFDVIGLSKSLRASKSLDDQICSSLSMELSAPSKTVSVPLKVEEDNPVFAEPITKCSTNIFYERGNKVGSSVSRRTSAFDDLLFDIYDRWHSGWRDSFDSDTFTDMTESDAVIGRSDWNPSETEAGKRHLNVAMLKNKDVFELDQMVSDIIHRISQMSSHLVRQLKCRERRLASLRDKCDIVTAILHASSLKRRIDSKIRFSIEPLPGDDAFSQWKDAMKAVARLPMGIPQEFRSKVWLALADNYLNSLCVDWEKTKRLAFNEKSNPDDSKLGLQIVKDLHRTGCSGFNGRDNEEDRAVLKRVLLAYARWNKLVGYCQGFNILAALILDVVDRKEDSALKIMIFLVDRVLPESYFANNLRALSVDMAVFRDLLRSHLVKLSKHLDHLQNAARDQTTGANYEPPLTNVFTMQWFLTLFATCLPKETALRVWDSVFLEGSEVLLRTAVAIWGTLESRILNIQSADEFYTSMGVLSQEMLDGKIVDADKLMKAIYAMASFPFPQLNELREKYTYNITPFTASLNAGKHPRAPMATAMVEGKPSAVYADDEDLDEDELLENINCFAGLFLSQHSPPTKMMNSEESSSDISKVSPGAYAATPVDIAISMPAYTDRVTLDIDMLHKQYKRLKQRQKQAHIILAAANARQKRSLAMTASSNSQDHGGSGGGALGAEIVPPTETQTAVNHLFVSRQMMNNRNRNISSPTATVALPGGSSRFASQQLSKWERNRPKPSGESLPEGRLTSAESWSSLSSDIGRKSDCNVSMDGSLHSDKENSPIGGSRGASDQDISTSSSAPLSTDIDLKTTHNSGTKLERSVSDAVLNEAPQSWHGDKTAAGATLEVFLVDDISAGGRIHPEDNSSVTVSKFDATSTKAATVKTQQDGLDADKKSTNELKSQETKLSSDDFLRRCTAATKGKFPAAKAGVYSAFFKDSHEQKASILVPQLKSNAEANVKVFNPFPKQYLNPRKTHNSIRLGLYAEESANRMDEGMLAAGQIRRSADQLHRTAYLQRQYMMEVAKQSKVNKS